jgi:hypothetical protein
VKLPPPPREVPVNGDMSGIAPKFRDAVERVLARMIDLGHDPMVYETLRTNERQSYLFGFGREYDDGRGVVTHSRGADQTWHHFGLAVDVISRSKHWDAPAQFWRDLETCVEAEGLVSGRDWDGSDATKESFVDSPHFQFGPGMRRSPSVRAIQLLASGGYAAVWNEVGAL